MQNSVNSMTTGFETQTAIYQLKQAVNRERLFRERAEADLESRQQQLRLVSSNLERLTGDLEQEFHRGCTVIANPADAVIEISASGRVSQFNEVAEKLLLRNSQDVVGHWFVDLFETTERDELRRILSSPTTIRQLSTGYHAICGDDRLVCVGINWIQASGILGRGVTAILTQQTPSEEFPRSAVQINKLETRSQLSESATAQMAKPIQDLNQKALELKGLMARFEHGLGRMADSVKQHQSATSPVETLDEVTEEVQMLVLQHEANQLISEILDSTQFLGGINDSISASCQPNDLHTEQNVNEVLTSVLSISHHAWKDLAEVQTEFSQDLPTIHCYPGAVAQAFYNLLMNSVQAIQCKYRLGDIKDVGRIVLETQATEGGVEISIRDNGTGVHPSSLDRVFEPYISSSSSIDVQTHQRYSVCHDLICRHHGGSLRLVPQLESGTEVCIQLPREPFLRSDPEYALRG